MWPEKFEDRLRDWHKLRESLSIMDVRSACWAINDWWFRSPWCPYYLHWDDHRDWPDPWQLLSDNVYCDLARGLGIMYTMIMVDHKELNEIALIETNLGNLVQVQGGKYIMNWEPGRLLNIESTKINIFRRLHPEALNHLTS